MRVFKILFSPTGGTAKAARILTEELSVYDASPKTIDLTNTAFDFSSAAFLPEDLCLFAVPVYGGRIPAPAAEHLSKLYGNGAKAILTVVYGNRDFDDALVELQDTAAAAGFVPIAAVTAIAEHSILRQYGKGRPDKKDEMELRGFASRIKELLDSPGNGELILPGIRPYKERAILPTMPIAGELCEGCGYCADVCPTGAIPKDHPDQTINDLCISCMRCTFVCPKKARYVRPNVAMILNEKLAKVAAQRKENKLYI